ncbi:MAG TPA: hypothetical protein DCW29_16395 [Janthinobacterium sp.]|nr:hypothetical protein [Janthinobacterium sp.]
MTQTGIALVLGATGAIGGEVARGLLARGWRVRALQRAPDSLARRDAGFEWIKGDAMVAADVARAARGASLIVHAVNPPGYRNWGELVLPMIDNTIAAARACGARILLPGTVYNFGPDVFPAPTEASAQHAPTRKGGIRVELERRLRAASADGVRTLIVRAGDFFGPRGAGNNWFSGALVKAGKPVDAVMYPGAKGVGHQWAYLPDLAETMLRLLDREAELPPFAVYHMRGHWDAAGTQMIDAVRRVAGRPRIKVRSFPWWALVLIAPFSETMREMREMRYLWQHGLYMDNARLLAVLGEEPHTPLDEAVRATLTGMRCV